MSDWIITAPTQRGRPYSIVTNDPKFDGVNFDDTSPMYRPYRLVDAVQFVGYRMAVGDRILTRRQREG